LNISAKLRKFIGFCCTFCLSIFVAGYKAFLPAAKRDNTHKIQYPQLLRWDKEKKLIEGDVCEKNEIESFSEE
jgi:hypothetical protein